MVKFNLQISPSFLSFIRIPLHYTSTNVSLAVMCLMSIGEPSHNFVNCIKTFSLRMKSKFNVLLDSQGAVEA